MNNMGEMLLDHYQKYLGNSLAPNHIATMNIKFNCWALTISSRIFRNNIIRQRYILQNLMFFRKIFQQSGESAKCIWDFLFPRMKRIM